MGCGSCGRKYSSISTPKAASRKSMSFRQRRRMRRNSGVVRKEPEVSETLPEQKVEVSDSHIPDPEE